MNNTTNTTGASRQQTIDEAEKMFKIVFYIALFIIGSIGNVLVVIVIKAKRQRSVNDYFILNLAISDLTFLCFSLPFYFYELFEKFVKFQFYCKFVWPMMSISLFVGIFTLTFMSVERCRAILFPFRPRIKKATLFIGILLVWMCAISCIIPLMVVASAEGIMCSELWPNETYRKAYTAALFILQFAVPITIIAVAYITIVVKLFKTKVPNRTLVNHRGQLVKQKTRTENIHIIRTVAIIVILFVACMLPNQIAWILMDFGGEQYKHLSEKFWLFAEALMFLHSCVNPIIYGSLTRQFRNGYIKYINYICCCGRSAQKTMDLSEHRDYHERPSHSRQRGRLTYKGSLKSPSVIKRRGSTQAATVISSLPTYRTSSPKTSASSPVQLSPVLLNNKLGNFLANGILRNVDIDAVDVHCNGFPNFIPCGLQSEEIEQQATCKDGNAIINQGVIMASENLQYSKDMEPPLAPVSFDENRAKHFDSSLNSKYSCEVEFIESQMDRDLTENNETKQHIQNTKILPSALQNNGGNFIPSSQNGSVVSVKPSLNYGIVDDEENSLQDTHL